MTAGLAQMERELTLERTHAGLAAAKQQGKVRGPKRQMTVKSTRTAAYLADGLAPREVAKKLGIFVPTSSAGCCRTLPGVQESRRRTS